MYRLRRIPARVLGRWRRRLRRAQQLQREGSLREAAALAARPARWPLPSAAQRIYAQASGELAVLEGGVQVGLDGRRRDAVPGRILHLVGKSAPHVLAGYTVRTEALCRAQLDAGLDPHVLSLVPHADTLDSITDVGSIPHHWLRRTPALTGPHDQRLVERVHRAARVVEQVRPAVLHAASDYENALVALELGRAFDLPVVYEVRGFWEETWLAGRPAEAADADRYRLRRARELACMKEADAVVTLSETMKAHILAGGVDENRVWIVPNAVDPGEFPVVERDRALAATFGIDDEVTVGYVSSLKRYEGIETLIEAIARLHERGLDVRGVIVGEGAARPGLEERAREVGVADAVVFTGSVPHDDIVSFYGLIDVFVVPRRDERVCHLVTPLKPIEAMSTGRPVVASATEALRHLIEESGAGEIFTPGDPEDLARVLEPLVNDEGRRRELGARGARWVREHRTWAQNGQRYLQLYDRLGVA